MRKAEPALHSGDYRQLIVKEEVFCFERKRGEDRILVAMNFPVKEHKVSLPDTGRWKPLLREGAMTEHKPFESPVTGQTTLPQYGVLIAKNMPD